MNVNTDLSLITLLLNASALVKLVIFILLAGSMLSWWYIFLKLFAIKRAQTMTDTFERNFWGGSDLNTLFQQATRGRHDPGSMEKIFEAGFREFLKHRRQQIKDCCAAVSASRCQTLLSTTTSRSRPASTRKTTASCTSAPTS